MLDTYEEAQAYLESLIKPFHMQRIEGTPQEYQNPLSRIEYLLNLLGNPHKKLRSIVVSGTSGKTSTTYYIACLLRAAGYKTGMTISPHLQKLNERIQINGQQISDEDFLQLLNEVKIAIDTMGKSPLGEPSYFETLLACAFLYFAKQQVDIVVAEVGLESKYDGTNVLDRLAFVYTNTSLDHTQILGETVEQIASETVAGIIPHTTQPGTPTVISGVSQTSILSLLKEACNKSGSSLILLGRDFSYKLVSTTQKGTTFSFKDVNSSLSNIEVSMEGDYQAENAALALEAVLQLKRFGYTISEEEIRYAFSTMHIPGRFEDFGTVILDGAHNPAKMNAFLHALQTLYPEKKKIFIVGFKEGKNITDMLGELLNVADSTVITTMFHTAIDTTKNPSLRAEQVYEAVANHPKRKAATIVYKTTHIHEALSLAKSLQENTANSIIIVTGSLYLVGEARKQLIP